MCHMQSDQFLPVHMNWDIFNRSNMMISSRNMVCTLRWIGVGFYDPRGHVPPGGSAFVFEASVGAALNQQPATGNWPFAKCGAPSHVMSTLRSPKKSNTPWVWICLSASIYLVCIRRD